MKLFSVAIISVIAVVAFVLPSGVQAASKNPFDISQRLEQVQERIGAINARFEKRLMEVEERVGQNQQRVCARLMSFGHEHLPPFCEGEPEPDAPTLDFSASPMTIDEGATSTLEWDSSNADTCVGSDGLSGSKPVDGSMEVAPTETTTYTLTCMGEGGEVEESVLVTVNPIVPVPDAPIVNFDADPMTIDEGATSTVTWSTTDADTCTGMDGFVGDKGTSGSEEVDPTATTIYTLECVGEGGTATESVTVTVTPTEPEPDAPTLDFSASPMTIDEGATSTLSWSTTNASVCEASDGWSGSMATSGSDVVVPSATTMYTLECVGEGGTTTESVTVTVTPSGPVAPTLDLSADPLEVLSGGTSTIVWDSSNADTCEADNGWSGSKLADGNEEVTVNATTTYELTCVGAGGTTTESVTVNVIEEDEEPAADHVVISEVFYDVDDATQGAEGENEWVELYNPTASPIDVMDWVVGNSTTTGEVIATTSLEIPAGGYLVITNATTTALFWDFTSVNVVYLGVAINNGFANGGDYIGLFDSSEGVVDEVSYGTDETVFGAGAPSASEGNSIARIPVEADKDEAGDWEEIDPPTPGSS